MFFTRPFADPKPEVSRILAEGTIERFGIYKAESVARYAFTLSGRPEAYDLMFGSIQHDGFRFGLLRQGDRIRIESPAPLKDGTVDRCTVTLIIDGREFVQSSGRLQMLPF